jgi:P-type Ca2+ transporter type 2A
VALRGAADAVLQRWGRDSALRCMALAYREVRNDGGVRELTFEDEAGLVFVGLVGLHDPPRPEARDAVHACQEAGIRIIMLTGARRGSFQSYQRLLETLNLFYSFTLSKQVLVLVCGMIPDDKGW